MLHKRSSEHRPRRVMLGKIDYQCLPLRRGRDGPLAHQKTIDLSARNSHAHSIPPSAYFPPPAPCSDLMWALIYACVRSEKEADWMANRLKLNEKILRDAEPQEGNSYQIFDTEIRGLAEDVVRSFQNTTSTTFGAVANNNSAGGFASFANSTGGGAFGSASATKPSSGNTSMWQARK